MFDLQESRIAEEGGRRVPSLDLGSVARRGLPAIAALFLIGLAVPLILYFGPLRLSTYRLVLLVAVVPCIVLWLIGRAGRWLLADFCIFAICAWSALSFLVVHGAESVEGIGMVFIETAGAWFLARCSVRTPQAFHGMARVLFVLLLLLLPLGIMESVSGKNVSLDLFGRLGRVFPDVPKQPRWGLDRVQGPFEHPILFGVFCGSIVGLVFYVLGYGRSWFSRVLQTGVVFVTAALALSSGPLTALTSQASLISWDLLLRRVRQRWWIFAGLAVLAYVTVDLLSNRTPAKVFASYFAFNPTTAYSRINIWEWGTRSIFNHPVFGIGLNDWERAPGMTASVDMFWIAPAMAHGIPVWILYFALFFSTVVPVIWRRGLDERMSAYRMGYLVSMGGFFVVGWTVHFWNATFVLFIFMLGSGAWLIDAQPESPSTTSRTKAPLRRRTLL